MDFKHQPMNGKQLTDEDIKNMIEEYDVQFIKLQFVDINGQVKNLAVPSEHIDRVLNNEMMLDGSSIKGFRNIETSDMFFYPDKNTFQILPWQEQNGRNSARVICDIYNADGTPFEGCPRCNLKRLMAEAQKLGLSMNVGPEAEFFLFEKDEEGHITTKTHDRAGYYDMGPDDLGEEVRTDIVSTLQDMGFDIEASHHEVADGQHEIDFKYSDILTTADNVVTFRIAVKAIAAQYGLHATFMPKPICGINGSGMHTNMSLFKDGVNIFADPSDKRGLSKEAYSFIAGILEHIRSMSAITNPLVNSYKRLVPGYEAPCYISWSASNRSALIRIPAARGQATRVELRCPDPSCNPYLELAVCLAAGLDGIERGLTPPDEILENIFAMNEETRKEKGIESLPGNLKEAVDLMLEDKIVCDTLGTHITEQYSAGKYAEWDAYRTSVSEWEINEYLMMY